MDTPDIAPSDSQPLSALAYQVARSILGSAGDRRPQYLISLADNRHARVLYRAMSSQRLPVAFLPAWEILAGEDADFFPPNAAARTEAIDAILSGAAEVVVTTHRSLIQKIPDTAQTLMHIRTDIRTDPQSLIATLEEAGFDRVPTVDDFGQFALRGDILDIYAPGGPYRLEFFDDEIERMTRFDADSQRSLEDLEQLRILRHREYENSPWEAQRRSIFEFLRPDARILIANPAEFERVFSRERNSATRLDPDRLWIRPEEVPAGVRWCSLHPQPASEWQGLGLDVVLERESLIEQFAGSRDLCLLCYRSEQGRERFERLVEQAGLKVAQAEHLGQAREGLWMVPFDIPSGASSRECVLLAERELFGTGQAASAGARRLSQGSTTYLSDLSMLRPGDYVVHVEYGVGIFRGIENLDTAGTRGDFLKIEYQRGDNLYVPNEKFHLVQKYIGSDETAPRLDRIGSKSWERRKSRARKTVADIADKLIRTNALRQQPKPHQYLQDSALYEEFIGRFPFEETPDQQRAIEDVLQDLYAAEPMDRLICGDVGYGKTEVALRAAVKAVESGLQVALLAPTTILVEQHYRMFKQRFEGFPVRIGMLSRFRTASQNRQVTTELADGTLDIVIGTHKLLGKGIEFSNLGLLIVDEEQRFGVAHKEKIKELRQGVDVLTLTATPIPRTLHMALGGVRPMSLIETPPKDRRAIRTEVVLFEDELLRESIMRELHRDGQVYFLHNRVETIDTIAVRVSAIVPEARIAVAHGQMPQKQLERIMIDFAQGDYDVLVCSSIVESGLDVSRANTMVINQADHFGLAQLYQLRGRVGRGDRQAYCYLVVPPRNAMNEVARKRIDVIQELAYLGAGFRLATYDLEIRGAGNIVGAEQSGQIAAVGFELYTQMLRRELAMQTGQEPEEFEPAVRTDWQAFIPEHYVDQTADRLSLYKRLSAARDLESIGEIADEMLDRFGSPPGEVRALVRVARLRETARPLLVDRLFLGRKQCSMVVGTASRVDMQRIVELVQQGRARLDPEGGVSLSTDWLGEAGLEGFLRQIATLNIGQQPA